MPKWLKMVCGVLLLPVCLGAVIALVRVLRFTGQVESFWMALTGGMACWWVVYLLLPKPMLLYVFGHEFTHVLWTWLFGGRVKRFKVSARGGHVLISKTNFLIALAPYFFPLYVVVVMVLFGLGHLVWDWSGHRVWLHWLVGAAYGFHLTLTWHILKTRQTDITGQGWFFSGVIIFLGNVLVLLIGLPLLTPGMDVSTSLGWWLEATGGVVRRLGAMR